VTSLPPTDTKHTTKTSINTQHTAKQSSPAEMLVQRTNNISHQAEDHNNELTTNTINDRKAIKIN